MPQPAVESSLDTRDAEAENSTEDPSAQRKKAKVDTPGKSHNPKVTSDSGPEPMDVDGTKKEDNAEESTEQNPSAAQQTQEEPVSDADWLRSKTSRLLGLLDEEEQAEFDASSNQKADASKEADADRNPEPQSAGDAVASPQADAGEKDAVEIDTNINLIRDSARLFVRNLPYDAKEADLQTLFAPFGKIEEVSTVLFGIIFYTLPVSPPISMVAPMMIFLIGTSDAKHMM